MRPTGSDGKKGLSFGAVSAWPRLPALITLDPESRHGGRRAKALWISPGIILNKCHPSYSQQKQLKASLDKNFD